APPLKHHASDRQSHQRTRPRPSASWLLWGSDREHAGRQLPVFNELELLTASKLSTFSVTLSAPDEDALRSLSSMAQIQEVPIEDWSTVDRLCVACGEGLVHSHTPDSPASEWKSRRMIGLAAIDSDRVHK